MAKRLTAAPAGVYSEIQFQELPEEALVAILKNMSCRPRSVNWQDFVQLEDIHSVLLSNAPLASTARREFSKLGFSSFEEDLNVILAMSFCHIPGEYRGHRWYLKYAATGETRVVCDSGAMQSDSKYILVGKVMELLGKSLKTFTLDAPSLIRIPGVRPAGHFSNLRSLSLMGKPADFDLNSVLEANSGQLRSLEIRGVRMRSKSIDSVAQHCAGLEKLYLGYIIVEVCLTSIWKSVGPTLVQLSTIIPRTADGSAQHTICCMRDISKYCRNVAQLGDAKDDISHNLPMSLVDDFGSQLRVIRMMGKGSCLYPTGLQKLKIASPFSVFDVFIEDELSDSLKILGDRLRTLKLFGEDFQRLVYIHCGDYGAYDDPEYHFCDGVEKSLELAFERCSAIEELIIDLKDTNELYRGLADVIYSIFLSTPKPQLRKVLVDLRPQCPFEGGRLPDTFAKITTGIEQISLYGFPLYRSCFRNFADSNKQLRYAHFYYTEVAGGDEQEFVPAVVSLIEDISKCPMLEELLIDTRHFSSWSERIADVCVPLRLRSIDIYISGFQYNN